MPTPNRKQIEASFGYSLREKRIERGLTHDQLAEQVRTAASEKTEEYQKYEASQLDLEVQVEQLNEELSYLVEAKSVDGSTIRDWERGSEVPNQKEVEILAGLLFGAQEKDIPAKEKFIELANQARSRSMYERISDRRNNPKNSFSAVLKEHLGGMEEIAIEEINNARKAEFAGVRGQIEQELQEVRENIADIKQKMLEKPEHYLLDGAKIKHRVVLTAEEKTTDQDILIKDAMYFMEAGMLPSQGLYDLLLKGLDRTRPLDKDKEDLDYRYKNEMTALDQPVELIGGRFAGTDPDRPRTSQEFVENCKELEEYARAHAAVFHALGYVAQQRSKNSPVEGVVVTNLHEQVSRKIGRSTSSMLELTPFFFENDPGTELRQAYLDDKTINALAENALPAGEDKEKFKALCRNYNDAKRKVVSIMRAEPDGVSSDIAIPEAKRLAESGGNLRETFAHLGVGNIVGYKEAPILSEWSYNKMLEGSLPSHRSFNTYFGRLKSKIDADQNVKKDRNFDDRYNGVTGGFMRDFYDYETAHNRFAERFSRIVGELNQQWARQNGKEDELVEPQTHTPHPIIPAQQDTAPEPVVPPVVVVPSADIAEVQTTPDVTTPPANTQQDLPSTVVEEVHTPDHRPSMNGKANGFIKPNRPMPKSTDDLVTEYATALAGVHLLLGVKPPVFDAADRHNDEAADQIAVKLGRKKGSLTELVPFSFKRIDSDVKSRLLSQVKTEEEKETLGQLLARLDEITPTLEGMLEKMPEKSRLKAAGERMLEACGGRLKEICINTGNYPVKTTREAMELLNGDLDAGDKLETYLKHISPAHREAFDSARRAGLNRFTSRPKELEPELAAFQEAHDAYHDIRRGLAGKFNSVVEDAHENTATLNGKIKGGNERLVAALTWLSKRGVINPEELEHLGHADQIEIRRQQNGQHDGAAPPPL